MIDRTHLRNFLNSIPGLEGWSDSVEHLNGVEMVIEALAEPTAEMLAFVLPRIGNPTDEHRAIGAAAVKLLGEEQPIAHTIAAELARDYEAMWSARFRGE